MKSLIVAIVLSATSFSVIADEIYEEQGIGYSDNANKACEEALLYAKKEALDSAGTIIRAASYINQEVKNKSSNTAATVDISQLSNGLIKVLAKKIETSSGKDGRIVCHVIASLSVDTTGVLQQNKKYEGQLPDWVITPPLVLGKHTIISNAKSLDAALALALKSYGEANNNQKKLDNYDGIIGALEEGRSQMEAQITTEKFNAYLHEQGMSKLKADDKNVIYTDLVNVTFDFLNKERVIKYYREQPQGEPMEELLEIVKDSATIDMLIESLKSSGFTIEYEQVVSGDVKEWYLMLIGKKKLPPKLKVVSTTSYSNNTTTETKKAVEIVANNCTFPGSSDRAPSWLCGETVEGYELTAVGSAPTGSASVDNKLPPFQHAILDAAAQLARNFFSTVSTAKQNRTVKQASNVRIGNITMVSLIKQYSESTGKDDSAPQILSTSTDKLVMETPCSYTMKKYVELVTKGKSETVKEVSDETTSECTINSVLKELYNAGVEVVDTARSKQGELFVLLGGKKVSELQIAY